MTAGAMAVKRMASEKYYANPSVCEQCGKVITVKNGRPPSSARNKRFCDHSCAAKYNNSDTYDWAKVQKFYDVGNSRADCIRHFSFSDSAFQGAVSRGALKTLQDRRWPSPFSLEDVMVENSTYKCGSLKARLLKLGILKNKCAICGITEWQGKPIVIRLDHINGINNDNRLENLRMVCPNCDSQLPTYCSKNKKNIAKHKKT